MPPSPSATASASSSASRKAWLMPWPVIGSMQQAGVTDQGPAGTVGLAQVAGQVGGAAEALGPAPGPDPLAQAHGVERAQEVALDVAAELVEPGRRPGQVGHQQAVVGRPGTDGAARPAVHLAGPAGLPAGHARPVGVERDRPRRRGAVGAGADRLATSECLPSAPMTRRACSVTSGRALLPAADAGNLAVAEDLVDREVLPDLGAGRPGRVHQDPVEQRAARAAHASTPW